MKVVSLLSGGMDSTALLAMLVAEGHEVVTVSVNYGQRHVKELDAARNIAAHFNVPHLTVDLTTLRDVLTGSALTDARDVPDGHYAEESMRVTVVPNRNAIMLSVAAGIAVAHRASAVYTAVHSGDHYIYPDCRPEFIEALSTATQAATDGFGNVPIVAPFVDVSKTEIARVGAQVNAPFHLSWSCYKGGAIHCGSCGTCFERREAFSEADVTDPTEYAALPDYDDPRS